MTHNLHQNYFSATGAGDGKMKRDILLSEIAKKIYTDRQGVINNLKVTGFGVPKQVDDQTLVKMVASALNRSKRFAKIMAKDVVMASYSADGKYYNLWGMFEGKNKAKSGTPTGSPPTDSQKTDFGKLFSDASKIVGGIGSIFGGKKRAEADKAASEAEKMRAEAELTEKLAAIKQTEKPGSTVVYWVLGGLVFAGVAGTLIYLAVRK